MEGHAAGREGAGQRVSRTYTESELEPFLETFAGLIEPASLARAPIGRTLGRNAGLVGLPLGELLHVVTGVDREALLSAATLSFPVTFESMDIADLHVICGALQHHADTICTSDGRLLGYDPIAETRVLRPGQLAAELGLTEASSMASQSARDIR